MVKPKTEIANVADAVFPSWSVACTAKMKSPAVVGKPTIEKLFVPGVKRIPPGNAPPTTSIVLVPTPPLTATAAE